jgi:putative MATE family efflux protein
LIFMPPNDPKDRLSRDHSAQPVAPPSVAVEADTLPQAAAPLRPGAGQGSLLKQVVLLAIWPLLDQVLNLSVGLVDTFVAGHLPGSQAVAATNAVGVGAYVEWLMSLMQSALGIGCAAIVARAVGGKHRRLANAALGQALLAAVSVGAFMGVLTLFISPGIASFAGLTGDSHAGCVSYIRILAIAAPMSAVLLVGNSALRAAGDTRTPFFVLVLVNVVNAICTLLFTLESSPLGGHGVAGIAAGTVVGWACGMTMLVVVLLRGWGGITLYWHRLRPHWHTLQRVLRVGLPSMFESAGQWCGNFLIITIVGKVMAAGTVGAIGAHMIAVRIEALSYLPGMAIGIAAATLVGQALGAGDVALAKRSANLCWGIGVAIMTTLGVVLLVAAGPMVAVMTTDEHLRQITPPLLRIAGGIQAFFASAMVLGAVLRGAGDTRWPMLLTYASTYLVRLPAAYVLGIVLGYGLNGVWMALCGELVVRGLLFIARYLHGGWARAKV